MDAIFAVPALFKILALFTLIVIIYRLKAPLWAALAIAGGLTGLWFGSGLTGTLGDLYHSASDIETLYLCAVVGLLYGYSEILDKSGNLRRIVAAFGSLLGKSIYSVAALPAFIGLLPMPGGAVFSAPMVENACGSGASQSPTQKAMINYLFRHVWEYWWPLYPGVILASSLFNIATWQMLFINWPLTITSLAASYFFVLRPAFRNSPESSPAETAATPFASRLAATLRESISIIILLAAIFLLGPAMKHLGIDTLSQRYLPVIIGTIIGIIQVSTAEKFPIRKVAEQLFSRKLLTMVLMAMGIMVFQGMIEYNDAFDSIKRDLDTFHLPLTALICFLPFVAGLVAGLAVGFVGISMPIVISLLTAAGIAGAGRLPYLTLAYTMGYMGMMLSPVHLCFIMTRDYFDADLLRMYLGLLPVLATIATVATGLFFLYLKLS